MNRICVFCGSSPGARTDYASAARRLGRVLAAQRLGLVYGGSNVGLMAELANAVLAAGGEVIGVIPRSLVEREVAHTGVTELRVVDTMHERKAMMTELADGFIALPGGLGTLDELFEVLTWAQLGLHAKPCGLLNVAGYFDGLATFLDHALRERFIRRAHRDLLLVGATPEELLGRLRTYQPAPEPKWLDSGAS